jgi:hypothetical protein
MWNFTKNLSEEEKRSFGSYLKNTSYINIDDQIENALVSLIREKTSKSNWTKKSYTHILSVARMVLNGNLQDWESVRSYFSV